MKARGLNWPVWVAFLLTTVAFVSYPFFFVQFPVTRDFPWVNFLMYAVAAVLLYIGVRRAFGPDSRRRGKITASVLSVLSVAVFGFFVLTFLISARQLPSSQEAPRVGQKAPDFQLTDTTGRSVSLNELLSAPLAGKAPRGVLLVFYRGYW